MNPINESRHMKDQKPDVKPIIKKEEEHFSLAEYSLIRRYTLNNCKNLHLPYPPQILNKTYSRAHISSFYGGNVQLPWVKVAKHRIRDGIRAYAAPRTNWNPHMPRRPGECGLLFSLWINEGEREREAPEGTSFPMFGRVKEGHWMYFGDYEFQASEGVSVHEWRELPLETKLICLSNMKKMKSWVPHPINTVTLARKIAEGGVPYLELDDIEESLARGEWRLETCTVNCTGYNTRLQQTLIGEPIQEIPLADLDSKPIITIERLRPPRDQDQDHAQLLEPEPDRESATPPPDFNFHTDPLGDLDSDENENETRFIERALWSLDPGPEPTQPTQPNPTPPLSSSHTNTNTRFSVTPLSSLPSPQSALFFCTIIVGLCVGILYPRIQQEY